MTTPRHTITGKVRRACPCETPALDRDAVRAGSVALALTARQVWLRDFPPPPSVPGRLVMTDFPPLAPLWGEPRSAVVSTWGVPAADRTKNEAAAR